MMTLTVPDQETLQYFLGNSTTVNRKGREGRGGGGGGRRVFKGWTSEGRGGIEGGLLVEKRGG